MNISNYLEHQLIRHTLGIAAYTPPTSTYIGILSDLSNDGDIITEFSGSNYQRQQVTATGFSSAASGATANVSSIVWPAALANWGSASYIGVFDSIAAGNLLWWGALTIAKAVSTSAIFRIDAGELDIGAAGAFSLYSRNGILNLTLRNNSPAFSSPAAIYAGIGTISGAYNDSLSEPSAGYSRTLVTAFTSAGNGVYTISAPQIEFTASGGNWGLMTHLGLFDAASGGNLIYALQLNPSRSVYDGDGILFEAGSVVIRVQ